MAGTAAFAQDASEQTEIRAVVARYAEAWNRHDIAALADILTDDTDLINIVGMHWRGRAAVLKGHDVYQRAFFRDTALDFTDVGSTAYYARRCSRRRYHQGWGLHATGRTAANRNSGPPIARRCQTFRRMANRAWPQYRH
jgi:uncharacterized protein (TIGR02246 family)